MQPRSILITGAASGIGRALAIACSEHGCPLYLADRNGPCLSETVAFCTARGAVAQAETLDVTDRDAMTDWITAAGPLGLVIASAGVNFSSIIGPAETPAQTRQIFDVNLGGVVNTVLPALEIMTAQAPDMHGVRGRIAVLASLGAFVAAPGAPAYCASKAAVDSWAVGLAPMARHRGVRITSICPGYVQTPMTDRNPFRMRGLMTPERAAHIILRGIRVGRMRVAFPWHMALAARIGSILPAGSAAFMLARRMRAMGA